MRLALEDIENLAGDPNIVIVEPAETLKSPRPLKGTSTTGGPTRVVGSERKKQDDGARILIGIIDVEGFDSGPSRFPRPDRQIALRQHLGPGRQGRTQPQGLESRTGDFRGRHG